MSRTPTRMRSDDGSAVIEFAFVVPVLVVLFLGMFESAMAFRVRNQYESAVRLAARTDSNLGHLRSADWNALTALKASLSNTPNTVVNYVIVYRGDPSNITTSVVPPTCKTAAETSPIKDSNWSGTVGYGLPASATPGPAPAVACNIYTRGMINGALPVANFGGSATPAPTTCATTDWDRFWCPTGRQNDLTQSNSGAGPDVLGMYIQFSYTSYTKMFMPTVTMQDYVVMRLEPSVS